MINYDKVDVSIWDYERNKVATIYSASNKTMTMATSPTLKHESNGWKEFSFSIAPSVNGEDNPLVEYLINEYLVYVDDGEYQDVFIISEPNINHNGLTKMIDVDCNHLSARLRMKKLYLTFDDTNGIGKCHDLISIVLSGTGWTLGNYDKFYEPDGVTEKIRTITSSGKEGAYQLINKICELFNARPVYDGMTQTVDIVAFAPYVFEGGDRPTLSSPESLIELCYSKTLSGVSRKLNTENMITRLYVEGDFGDDGYIGIESVNPLKTNFLLNFDYFKAVGLFKPQHQSYIDTYLDYITSYRDQIKEASLAISDKETRLMDLWGTADYSIYEISNVVNDTTLDVTHYTSLGDTRTISVGNTAVIIHENGEQIRTKVTNVNGSRITIEKPTLSGTNITDVLIYRTPPSGSIGGKEAAAEAKEEKYEELINKVGENLVKESDIAISKSTYHIHNYTTTEDLISGKRYTITIWGTVNAGNQFGVWGDNGSKHMTYLEYDAQKRCWIGTFTCLDLTNKQMVNIYNAPSATAGTSSIQRIKIEHGEVGTPWTPANPQRTNELIEEYRLGIETLYNGTDDTRGIYDLTRDAVAIARTLEEHRVAYRDAVTNTNNTENTFAENMGDMLRDGYWQDSSYVVGQELNLYTDALKTHEVMSKPVAEYQLQIIDMAGVDAAPYLTYSINTPAHIIDEEISIDAWGYVEEAVWVFDSPSKNSIKISTQEAKFAGQSFTQIISQIAETARDVRERKSIFGRAHIISKDGEVSTKHLNGILDAEVVRILSRTSNWMTDDRGNMIFTAQDGSSAMMLTGEGFLIADGKKSDGSWNWRSAGTGKGFTADAITAGTLQAGIVKILGTDQFFWDADNIYIFDPTDPKRQIRMGRYDGVNYGIGFTKDDGANWVSAFGFDGVNLNYATFDVSQVTGIGDVYLEKDEATGLFETKTNVGAINAVLNQLNNDIRQNILFTAGGIIINQQGATSGFSSRFTSTALEFYEGSNRIAWFSNRTLNVENTQVTKQHAIGKLIWTVNSDQSVSVKWLK